MPELPEVETIRRALAVMMTDAVLQDVEILNPNLRWKIDSQALIRLKQEPLLEITRRAKYLLFRFPHQTLLIHLGMSGRLKIALPDDIFEKHTHVIFHFSNNRTLQYRDPRRFGFILVFDNDSLSVRLKDLGAEPLSSQFSFEYISPFLKGRRPVKNMIMDNRIVVGIGNIYANESLFLAGLRPDRPVGQLSEQQVKRIVEKVKQVLALAIDAGGTTLRDYQNAQGEPGFFQLNLNVYGRVNEPCPVCSAAIEKIMLAGRSCFFCPNCQV